MYALFSGISNSWASRYLIEVSGSIEPRVDEVFEKCKLPYG